MKKFFVLTLALAMLLSIASFADFDYAHFVAAGNDPYGTIKFDETIDPATTKWAAIKYRTVTKTDNTGVDLIGQIYIDPAAEPFCPVKWNHSQKWETIVVDLTSVSEKTTLTEIWTGAAGTGFRLDPMESNRDAEAASNSTDTAVVADGDSIDIAYIAFFNSEADAKAFDGTNGAVALITAEDLAAIAVGNNLSVEVKTEVEAAPAPAPEVTPDAPAAGAGAAQTADMVSLSVAAAVLALGAVVISKKR